MHWRLLSVCPSVCYVPDPKLRTEEHSKLKIGRKEAHDMWPMIPFRIWKVKHLCGRREFWCRTAWVFYSNVNVQWTISVLWPASWKLWGLFKSPLAGAHCGGPTACYNIDNVCPVQMCFKFSSDIQARYGIVEFNVPLDTVQVILEMGALSSDIHLPFFMLAT